MGINKKSNLKKKNIINFINIKTGLNISYSNKILDNLISVLKESIKKDNIKINNFGTFKLLKKKQRLGRNPKTNEIYNIKARTSLSFIASKKIIKQINND